MATEAAVLLKQRLAFRGIAELDGAGLVLREESDVGDEGGEIRARQIVGRHHGARDAVADGVHEIVVGGTARKLAGSKIYAGDAGAVSMAFGAIRGIESRAAVNLEPLIILLHLLGLKWI
jgi:hypothetical protein